MDLTEQQMNIRIVVQENDMLSPAKYYIDHTCISNKSSESMVIKEFKNGLYKVAEERNDIQLLNEYINHIHGLILEQNATLLTQSIVNDQKDQGDEDLDDQTFLKLSFIAILESRRDILQLCFDSGTNINMFRNSDGFDINMYAVNMCDVDMDMFCDMVQKMKTDNYLAANGGHILNTCLQNMSMKSSKKIEVVKELLRAGADMKITQTTMSTALHIYVPCIASSETQWREIIQLLLNTGLDINEGDWTGSTALHQAVQQIPQEDANETSDSCINTKMLFEVVNFLMDHDADPNIRDFNGKSCIHWGVSTLNVKALKLLLERNCNANIKDDLGLTAIFILVSYFDWTEDDPTIELILQPMLVMLLNAGCDINAPALDDSTVLHYAAATKASKVCELLCQYSADVTKRDYLHRTPLHMAVKNTDIKIMELLIRHGADVHAKDVKNDTPVHHACLFDNKNAVETLVKYGAQIQAKGHLGIQPLHLAAENGSSELMKYMIVNADIAASDDFGAQPLHYAASEGNEDAADILIDAGADINKRDNGGMQPFDFARYRGHLKLAGRLLEPMSNIEIRFGNLALGCHPNDLPQEAKDVDKYFEDTIKIFKNESVKGIDLAKQMLVGEGFGSILYQKNEADIIEKTIYKYASQIVKHIGELDPLFECELIRAGSTFEGVKTGYPDEFDFLCNLTRFIQYVEKIENGEADGYAKVIVKSTAPSEIQRFCTSLNCTINAVSFLRYFRQLFLKAFVKVLREGIDNIYVGDMLVTTYQQLFTSDVCILDKLNSQTLTFRGQKHKFMDVHIDLNPVIFIKQIPKWDVEGCCCIKDLTAMGIYIIPKHCPQGFPEFESGRMQFETNLWRYSTQHMEAKVMQSLPQEARDSYMLCKMFRMMPITCNVKYHNSYHDNYFENHNDLGSEGRLWSPALQSIDDDSENHTQEHLMQLYPEESLECAAASIDDEEENMTLSSVDENSEYGEEFMTGETFIPSYYLKAIFINEVEHMLQSNEHFTERSLTSIPRKVYTILQKAFEDEKLFMVLMPRHNILQKKVHPNHFVYQMRKKYVNHILKLLDVIEFY